MAKWTKDELLDVCRTETEQCKKKMRENFYCTTEGIKQLHTEKPNECQLFFTNLIGRPFDVNNEAHITLVIEKAFHNPDRMSDYILFVYENFSSDTRETKKETKEESQMTDGQNTTTIPPGADQGAQQGGEQKVRKPRGKRNFTPQAPFTPNSAKAVIFEELRNWPGTQTDFVPHITNVLNQKGIKAKLPAMIKSTMRTAKRRGANFVVNKEADTVRVAS